MLNYLLWLLTALIGLLWFLDEILSLKNVKKYAIEHNRPPLIAWALHHHLRGLIYIKLIIYVAFVVVAAELIKKYIYLFHALALLLILCYLIFDIHVQRRR